MSSDDVDISERNIIGGIDRFFTNSCLAILSIVPTMLCVLIRPGRLVSLVAEDRASGREGMFLAPGVFFPAIFVGSLLMLGFASVEFAIVAKEGTNAGITGANINSTAQAWREGDYNQILRIMLPIMGIPVLASALATWLQVIVGKWWTIRTAIRTGFYLYGALIGSLGLAGLAISLAQPTDEQQALTSSILGFVSVASFVWVLVGFFRVGCQISYWRALVAAVLHLITFLVTVFIVVTAFS